ncbi:MAG: hypothetical protein EBT55_06625 [Proteobacteria bacterium]|nr:hypothetical protein [Pseudomonadota bacterium]
MPEESILPVKNTFIHFDEEETYPKLPRSQSAPAILITELNQEEPETIKQKLQKLIAKLNPTEGQPVSFEKHLAEEFKKNPDNFDFSQFNFLRSDVKIFGLNQENFNSAVESLDQMKKLYDFLNQNNGETITREQLETYTTPTTHCTDALEEHFLLYHPIDGNTVTIPCYAAPLLEEPQIKIQAR